MLKNTNQYTEILIQTQNLCIQNLIVPCTLSFPCAFFFFHMAQMRPQDMVPPLPKKKVSTSRITPKQQPNGYKWLK